MTHETDFEIRARVVANDVRRLIREGEDVRHLFERAGSYLGVESLHLGLACHPERRALGDEPVEDQLYLTLLQLDEKENPGALRARVLIALAIQCFYRDETWWPPELMVDWPGVRDWLDQQMLHAAG